MDMQWKCINGTLQISTHNINDKVSDLAHFFFTDSRIQLKVEFNQVIFDEKSYTGQGFS